MTSELHHLAGAYALDALEDSERVAFEQHLASCDSCAVEVADFRATAAMLAEGVATAPPPHLKSKVMAEVARTRQVPPTVVPLRGRRPIRMAVASVAAGLLIVALGAAAVLRSGRTDGIEDVIAAADAVTVNLAATEDLEGDPGMLRLVWSAERDEVVVIGDGLADPGAGKVHQLWLLVDDEAVPEDLLVPEDGAIRQVLEVSDRTAEGWGVTIEPATGSATPSPPILYAG
ncbi:MAG: anti-sigma factor [Actinomycetota bacterium]|nr:anti-sigma factor [Actinomycetota bacterium]